VSGALRDAAAALDGLLVRAAAATDAALAEPLATRAALERTAAALEESALLTGQVEPLVRALLDALAGQLGAQRDRGEALRARAEELAARRRSYEELVRGYAALGSAAGEVHRLLQAFGAEGGGLPTASLREVEEALARLIEGAVRAADAARESEFEDLAGEADHLRRQLVDARDQLSAAAERFAGAPLH
jgi:hypothetical protein